MAHFKRSHRNLGPRSEGSDMGVEKQLSRVVTSHYISTTRRHGSMAGYMACDHEVQCSPPGLESGLVCGWETQPGGVCPSDTTLVPSPWCQCQGKYKTPHKRYHVVGYYKHITACLRLVRLHLLMPRKSP